MYVSVVSAYADDRSLVSSKPLTDILTMRDTDIDGNVLRFDLGLDTPWHTCPAE